MDYSYCILLPSHMPLAYEAYEVPWDLMLPLFPLSFDQFPPITNIVVSAFEYCTSRLKKNSFYFSMTYWSRAEVRNPMLEIPGMWSESSFPYLCQWMHKSVGLIGVFTGTQTLSVPKSSSRTLENSGRAKSACPAGKSKKSGEIKKRLWLFQ